MRSLYNSIVHVHECTHFLNMLMHLYKYSNNMTGFPTGTRMYKECVYVSIQHLNVVYINDS
jgi:hypothetical protein